MTNENDTSKNESVSGASNNDQPLPAGDTAANTAMAAEPKAPGCCRKKKQRVWLAAALAVVLAAAVGFGAYNYGYRMGMQANLTSSVSGFPDRAQGGERGFPGADQSGSSDSQGTQDSSGSQASGQPDTQSGATSNQSSSN